MPASAKIRTHTRLVLRVVEMRIVWIGPIGIIADIGRKTRSEYHKAIKTAKHSENDLRFSNMATDFEQGDFWTQVKRMKGASAGLPCVDGVSEEEKIFGLFARKYQQLYTSVPCNENRMNEISHMNQNRVIVHLIAYQCTMSSQLLVKWNVTSMVVLGDCIQIT